MEGCKRRVNINRALAATRAQKGGKEGEGAKFTQDYVTVNHVAARAWYSEKALF